MPSVLVTGGFSNLGLSVCKLFHSEGWEVMATSTSRKELPPFIDRLFTMDLSKRGEIKFPGVGELDCLVNNAGVFTEEGPDGASEEDWDKVYDLNVKGLYYTIQELLPALKQVDGSVVNISSMNALRPGFGSTAHYDGSKGAVSAMTRSLALETGLRVNALAPGLISRPSLTGSGLESLWKERAVRKEMMDTEDLAKWVHALATGKGMYGQTILVDNGWTLG